MVSDLKEVAAVDAWLEKLCRRPGASPSDTKLVKDAIANNSKVAHARDVANKFVHLCLNINTAIYTYIHMLPTSTRKRQVAQYIALHTYVVLHRSMLNQGLASV